MKEHREKSNFLEDDNRICGKKFINKICIKYIKTMHGMSLQFATLWVGKSLALNIFGDLGSNNQQKDDTCHFMCNAYDSLD